MTAPKRIQRKRTKGWKMPEGAVYVGRPTKWGNPYVVDEHQSAAEAVRGYRWLVTHGMKWDHLNVIKPPMDRIADLRGRDLACWCPLDRPCHADVLLAMANIHEPAVDERGDEQPYCAQDGHIWPCEWVPCRGCDSRQVYEDLPPEFISADCPAHGHLLHRFWGKP